MVDLPAGEFFPADPTTDCQACAAGIPRYVNAEGAAIHMTEPTGDLFRCPVATQEERSSQPSKENQ